MRPTKMYFSENNCFRRNTTGKVIYLDNNATTAVDPLVLDAMLPFLRDRYGNPSSIHRFGGMVRRHIDAARSQVAALLGCGPEEIFFTSCGTESDSMAIAGFAKTHKARTRIITSSVEHPAVRALCASLKEDGFEVFEIGVDTHGLLRTDQLKHIPLDSDTLLTFMWANNETGVLFPVEELAKKAHSNGAFFHTDAVQAVGKIPINLAGSEIDILSLSGHKLHAPKGIGALFIRKGTRLSPFLLGGHQEHGMRAGTENVASIVGLGKACECALSHIEEENTRVRKLRDRLEAGLLSTCTAAHRNGDAEKRLPNTTNISFEFIEGEGILLLLDEKGIAASSGSACTSGSLEPSHVMMAMGIPYTLAHSSTRFSLSRYSTDADVDETLAAMPAIVERLRKLSPYVK
jgi:cysteine desulfurase